MINFITGAPGVGKSTLGDKIGRLDGFAHIDSDRVMLKIEENIEDYIRLIMTEIPDEIKPRSEQEFGQRGLNGEFEKYISLGLFRRTLQQAIENNNAGINSVISSGLPTAEARTYVTQSLKQEGVSAGIINLRGNIADLIKTAEERENIRLKGDRRFACTESVKLYFKKETTPLYSEGWDKVITLERDKIRKEAWEIPELQFLFH